MWENKIELFFACVCVCVHSPPLSVQHFLTVILIRMVSRTGGERERWKDDNESPFLSSRVFISILLFPPTHVFGIIPSRNTRHIMHADTQSPSGRGMNSFSAFFRVLVRLPSLNQSKIRVPHINETKPKKKKKGLRCVYRVKN